MDLLYDSDSNYLLNKHNTKILIANFSIILSLVEYGLEILTHKQTFKLNKNV